jgi:phenylalanyl-tRNA synthetase alpha chain
MNAHSLQNLLSETKLRLTSGEDRESLRLEVLGRKGSLAKLLEELPSLSSEDRAATGKVLNEVKRQLQDLLVTENVSKNSSSSADLTVPESQIDFGSLHPISMMIEKMVDIFKELSFEVVEGNELVTELDNFESLNLHKDHPARDGHDTFYVEDDVLLRTHTSAYQVEEMARRLRNKEMPIRFVVPGKTYRRESDQTHSAMFHQLEGVVVDTQTTFADLKGTLDYLVKRLFGDQVETRFRPHHFPFTEPSAEVDIRFIGAQGEGKQTGWLEMLGCGMIHPKVLERAGINPRIYQGWAFGTSIERPIMIKNQVSDLRKLFENSLHFLNQFPEV